MDHFPAFFHALVPQRPEGQPLPQAPFIWNQEVIQRLRHQQLRLLLRRERLLSPGYDDNAAPECQEIISSTLHMLQGPPALGSVPVGRLKMVFYITITLLLLICLINGRQRMTLIRPDAIVCFRTELEMSSAFEPRCEYLATSYQLCRISLLS